MHAMATPIRDRTMTATDWVIGFAMVFPTMVTLAYFDWLAGGNPTVQKAVYLIGKVLQFALPIVWVWGFQRRRELPPLKAGGVGIGVVFGLLVMAAMLGLHHGVLRPAGFYDEPTTSGVTPAAELHAKIRQMGLEPLAAYAAASAFYALVHSFLEEYYFRWFVFGQLRERQWPAGAAILWSSLAFMAHHVIVLKTYFGWFSPYTYLLAGAIAIGGAIWAWLYHRHGSLLGPWLGHLIVDAAIFTIGLGFRAA